MTRLRHVSPSDPGWRRVRHGRGFRYLDRRGRPLSAEDTRRVIDLVIPPAWEDVWVTPYASGHLQAVGTDAAGRRQYLYHPEWRRRRDAEKFDRALALGLRLPPARHSAVEVLDAFAASPGSVVSLDVALAAAFRLVDLGAFRLGDDTYAEQHGSYGLTTLLCRHVTRSTGRLLFEFPGKSGVEHTMILEDPGVYAAVSAMLSRRRRVHPALAHRDGRAWAPLTPAQVNDHLRSLLGCNATAKDLRTWHGTVRGAEALAEEPVPRSQRARARRVVAAYDAVADLLGNTRAVARASYVDPRVIEQFEEGHTIGRTLNRLSPDPVTAQDQLDRAVSRLLRG